ncbi:putative serine protease K12H4.7 isoform X2 [Nematostella vectensis]|uniref:putative serine protease K12H4.7 isoform X2 n=1 Tax=Nematostella vectensis TaxID=45351 RepID=UPI00207720C7|nr:putative serine protease K12H4.7 isoform X2 [Nematostella vectensis]
MRSNIQQFLFFFTFLFTAFYEGEAVRLYLGRPKGGMLQAPKIPLGFSAPPENWFIQRLDHFDDSNTETWKQRFYYNDTFRKTKDSPVFLMVGGEGAISPVWVLIGNMMKYAEGFGAMAFILEHRFYGQSHPRSDMSDANLKYLNSEQALADLAAFRQAMSVKFNLTDSKWISFGGSYPGSLSAWLRLKYPHLIHGAVASSAPVLAQLYFPEYLEVVTASLETTGPDCTKNIANATAVIEELLDADQGTKKLTDLFRVCEPLNRRNDNDVSTFSSNLAGLFMGVVQYNKDNRAFEGVPGTNITIATVCGIMNDKSLGPALMRYAKLNSLILDTYGEKCLDASYQNAINSLRNVSWDSSAAEGGRQWTYQTCTEFGFYQTTDSDNQPFGKRFPLKYSIQQCMDVFGEAFNSSNLASGIRQTNTNYGGKGIASSRIVFPNEFMSVSFVSFRLCFLNGLSLSPLFLPDCVS